MPFFLLMLGIAAWTVRPAIRTLWGVGMLFVFMHCLLDYPMQQRPALAAFFFAMLGAVCVERASACDGGFSLRLDLG